MYMKRLKVSEIDSWKKTVHEPHHILVLYTPESEYAVVIQPETINMTNLSGQEERELDLALIDSPHLWHGTRKGWLSTAISACSVPNLILNHSSISGGVYTDLDENLMFGNINIQEYFTIIKQKLEYFQLEDLIDNLPEGEEEFKSKIQIYEDIFAKFGVLENEKIGERHA